jgi:hypothetical protein
MIAEYHRREQNARSTLDALDIAANFSDVSGDVTAVDMRQLDSWQSLSNPEVQMIQRARANTHQHLILARTHVGNVLILENLRPAELVETDSFHDWFSPQETRSTQKSKAKLNTEDTEATKV